MMKIHFIGIGGVGISALARMYLAKGFQISGTNDSESPRTLDYLRERGVSISLDLDPKNLPEADMYIYSDAWLTNNPQVLEEAKKRGVQTRSYFEALGVISKEYKVIAVSGTHGKTTTTAMIADVLEDARIDPTIIVGSIRSKTGSNFQNGKGEYLLVEADEYMRHFLNFTPEILVINNIDEDHLDYYKDIEDIQSAFRELAEKISEDGHIICDKDDEKVKPVLKSVKANIFDYKELLNLEEKFNLMVPGRYNRLNALVALAVAKVMNLNLDKAIQSLNNFKGTWRRQEYKGVTKNGAIVYDDYAHHPREVEVTIDAFREKFNDKKIVIVFQPHLYSRTKLLFKEFGESFNCADKVILAPIYAAREERDGSISSEMLAEEIGKKAEAIETEEEIVQKLKQFSDSSTLIITMGAGDINRVGEKLLTI